MTTTASSYCVKCGYRIDAGLQFCPQCGEPAQMGVSSSAPKAPHRWMDEGSGRPAGSPDPHAASQPTHAQHQPASGQQPQPAPQWAPPPAQPYSQPPQYIPPPTPAPYVVNYQPYPAPPPGKTGKISTVGMTMGIIAMCLAVVGLVPCLGWLNWLTLLVAPVADIVSFVAVLTERRQVPSPVGRALVGLILAFVATFVGGIRLVLGGGCI